MLVPVISPTKKKKLRARRNTAVKWEEGEFWVETKIEVQKIENKGDVKFEELDTIEER